MSALPGDAARLSGPPATVQEYYFRGDSACCEKKLVKWLRDENRSDGHKGRITFGISVRMTASSRAHRSLGGKPLETISRGHGDDQRVHRCVELLVGSRSDRKRLARKTWLGVRHLKKQLADWIESLRPLPVPIRT
jgi:hypothetical protein